MSNGKPMNAFAFVATCYPLGLAPKAPGTWGSLPGIGLGLVVYWLSSLPGEALSNGMAAALLIIGSLLSWWVIHKTETLWGTHDDKSIVLDEVIGQAIPLAFFEPNPTIIVVGFVLFRLFDIAKPGPIGWADKHLKGSWGTLFDDILAGIAVLILFSIDGLWFHFLI